jgi:hypothetical protein
LTATACGLTGIEKLWADKILSRTCERRIRQSGPAV